MAGEIHKQNMACERQLESKRAKGKVQLVVIPLNAGRITNKLSSIKDALRTKKVDVAVIHELNTVNPPDIRGYKIFHVRDDRNFIGTAIYVAVR